MLPVYLVHWNAPDWVRGATDSLLTSVPAVAVAVVNNGPPQASLSLDPRVRIIETGQNLGFAGGANRAIDDWMGTEKPYCVIGSHDSHVEPHTLRSLVEAANRHPDLGIVGTVSNPGGYGDVLEDRGDVLVRTWASGSMLLLRRDCIAEVGGFDEAYGSYTEDLDLGLRVTDHPRWRVGQALHAPVKGLGSSIGNPIGMMRANRVRLRLKREGRWPAFKQWLGVVGWTARYVGLSAIPGPVRRRNRPYVRSHLTAVRRGARFLVQRRPNRR
jgi:N-acetylglucosaminyl-diphospho-decaprenol L-rhamnosyltransferase